VANVLGGLGYNRTARAKVTGGGKAVTSAGLDLLKRGRR
jgi:hypothetical protein